MKREADSGGGCIQVAEAYWGHASGMIATISEHDLLHFRNPPCQCAIMDIVDAAKRSAMMGSIRGKDTKPELAVRRVAHALGYRFRLHQRDLPGSPDLVFPRLQRVIWVHGCYWHRHEGCRFAYEPKSNGDFWREKFKKNQERDTRVFAELVDRGWRPLVIWECETRDPEGLKARIASHLGERGEL